MSRFGVNISLLVMIAILALLAWFLRRDFKQPNYVFTPEMVFSVPYDSFAPNQNFVDGKTQQTPVDGTVPRDTHYFDYVATEADAERAANDPNLVSPLSSEQDADRLQLAHDRGRSLYSTFCLPCHGPVGNADGAVAMNGFLGVTPLSSESALKMSDGQMFHLVTFGQRFVKDKRMPGYAAQISAEDRWKVILYVNSLQDAAVRRIEAEKKARESIERGKKLFEKLNCLKCHPTDPKEKSVGPDLSKISQVYTRDQLREAILHPSKSIADGFKAEEFLMMDGSTQIGFVTEKTNEKITIRNTKGDPVVLLIEDIDEQRTLDNSPMPDGLIKELADEEVESLLDFLKSIPAKPTTDQAEKGDPASQQDQANPSKKN